MCFPTQVQSAYKKGPREDWDVADYLIMVIFKSQPSNFSKVLIVKNKTILDICGRIAIQESQMTLVECYGSTIHNIFEGPCVSSNIREIGRSPHDLMLNKSVHLVEVQNSISKDVQERQFEVLHRSDKGVQEGIKREMHIVEIQLS